MERLKLEEKFFKEEVWNYYGYILKLMYTSTLDSNIADDLAQETMLPRWKNMDIIRKYKNLKAALIRIAKNQCSAYYRSRKKADEVLADPERLKWVAGSSNIEDCAPCRLL